eukprot:7722180-Alexandrium_andersonii.AAC.1
MSASLVGSEMCIRDRLRSFRRVTKASRPQGCSSTLQRASSCAGAAGSSPCLLYTSDAADDM